MRVLITGSRSEISQSLSEHLEARGTSVILSTPDRSRVGPGRTWFDFNKIEESRESFRSFLAEEPVDALILNAFQRLPALRLFHEWSWEDAERYVSVNVLGNMALVHEVLPGWVKRGFGRLILVSSVSAGSGTSQYSVYCAAKAALEGLVANIAVDYGHLNVTANVLRLGIFETARHEARIRSERHLERLERVVPAGRLGKPGEIRGIVDALLEDPCYINGATIDVSGGLPRVRSSGVLIRSP
jgi:3-oxoacyl-[acyl-carrier protein] reductase